METESDTKIVNIFPAIIERDRRKICQCEDPTYVIDENNHLVYCKECGAILDPWSVLFEIAGRWEKIAQTMAREKEKLEIWREEEKKIMRFRGVQDITRNYKNGMWPVCPHCKKAFDPSSIVRFVGAKFYGLSSQQEECDEHGNQQK